MQLWRSYKRLQCALQEHRTNIHLYSRFIQLYRHFLDTETALNVHVLGQTHQIF